MENMTVETTAGNQAYREVLIQRFKESWLFSSLLGQGGTYSIYIDEIVRPCQPKNIDDDIAVSGKKKRDLNKVQQAMKHSSIE